MAKNRGLFLHTILTSSRFQEGTEGRARLFEMVSSEARAILENPIFTSSWYDERISVEVANAMIEILGIEGDDAIKQHFRTLQLPGLGRIYKFILSMMTPEIVAKRAPWFWGRTHDSGEVDVEMKPQHVIGHIRNSPTVADPVYSLAVLGGIEGVISMTGTPHLTSSRTILDRETTRYEIRWPPKPK